MINSEVGIYNLALNAIGARNNVVSPTEASREAEVCRLWYSPVRDQILSGAVWPEATKTAYLALLNTADDDGVWESGEARPQYTYAYALPSDCLRPQYLTNFDKFFVGYYSPGVKALMCNTEDALLTYTMRLETIGMWSAELQMAVVYALAANICLPLSGKPQRAKMLAGQANQYLYQARETAANTSNEQFDVVPDWLSIRGYGAVSSTQYYYPLGSVISVGSTTE